MYHSYFGIEEQAFSIAVNPRYLYMSAQHREALAHLLYGVNSGGFVMLTGEVGTGKTTIIRCPGATAQTRRRGHDHEPIASARDLLCSICDELAIDYLADETSPKSSRINQRIPAHQPQQRPQHHSVDRRSPAVAGIHSGANSPAHQP